MNGLTVKLKRLPQKHKYYNELIDNMIRRLNWSIEELTCEYSKVIFEHRSGKIYFEYNDETTQVIDPSVLPAKGGYIKHLTKSRYFQLMENYYSDLYWVDKEQKQNPNFVEIQTVGIYFNDELAFAMR